MKEWNLNDLYTGYDSEAFQQDFAALDTHINAMNALAESLGQRDPHSTLKAIIEQLSAYQTLTRRLGAYLSLRQSANTADQQTVSMNSRFQIKTSQSALASTRFQKWIAAQDLDALIPGDPLFQQHAFWLQEIRSHAAHTLSDEVEDAIGKMELNGSNAWAQLQEYMTSTVAVTMDGQDYTLSSIRNLAYSTDPTVRKKAYEAELKAYDKIKDAVCFALNSIKGEANTVSELRHFDSVLDMTLFNSRMRKETLDAMFTAIDEALPRFHAYLRHKAELLGYTDGLPFYELFALMGKSTRTFTTDEAKAYLIQNFTPFSKDVAGIIERAFDEEWIDFFPRKGKVGGAFCCNLPMLKQSRVLTNFDGSLSDVVTLAHELGHAYHGHRIENHSPLNTRYSMPVAETASTFNETVIMIAAIRDAASDEEKMMLIESTLQDVTQVICDIYSRYLFETEVVEKRKDGFLFSDDLEDIMLRAQKKAYGTGLDHNQLHPYMWICKSHYYDAGLNFYNFPYAFGCLFAKGLYAQYQKEGPAFVDKYNRLLEATTVSSVEDVAAMAGIDITLPDFWRDSLAIVETMIDEFIALSAK
ncbi:M3 family oligoendopeptidase [Holdemania filiformis]|uniref:M3 family oligoendopeptidase n=1 Tax=Holdemania filiformis TaxID=61171 RepID=UPI0024305B5A|nr:M3 family oligoendopeptidase [Holdemania filiformis]MBS5003156.1 M3 family oligoendopeptidase [Holdemania filiformis]